MPVRSHALPNLFTWLRLGCFVLLGSIPSLAGAQRGPASPETSAAHDTLHLHGGFKGWAYQDDKIEVEAPAGWGLAYYVLPNSEGTYGGVELRKENYLLRLCTGCGQASGVEGGRFSEIAGMVQPWFRIDPAATPIALW